MSKRSANWFLGACLMAACACLGAPSGAAAGAYTVRTCGADPGFSSQAFGAPFLSRGMRLRRACNDEGRGRRGLLVGNVPRRGRVAFGARSIVTLAAPAGAHFRGYHWSGRVRRRDCGYALQLYSTGAGAARYDIRNRQAGRSCPRRGRAQISRIPRVRRYAIGDDRAGPNLIVQRADCRSRNGCASGGENYVATYKGVVEVVDHSAPQVQITGGTLASGAWVSGEQTVDYTASDNVGVASAKPVVGGVVGRVGDRRCDYTTLVPCPNGPATLAVTTKALAEGTQPLVVDAQDAAGNPGRSQAVTARVDNTPPPRVDVAVEGGEGWRRTPDFALAWSNASEGDRAPIAASHHGLCGVGAMPCGAAVRTAGQDIARLDVKAPAPGEHTVTVWREDAAGNQESDNASVPVTLRYDPEAPQPVFEALSPADPTRVTVQVTDKVSGLAGGTIEISRRGSGSWQSLATQQEGDRLVTRLDDSQLPPGEYELRARAVDRAGNEGSTDRRADGSPMIIRAPLRISSRLRTGVLSRKVVRRRVGRGKRRRTVRRRVIVLSERRKARFGKRVAIAGKLTSDGDQGITGAQLGVYSRSATSAERLLGTVVTDAAGRYRYVMPADSSQTIRLVYAGTATTLPTQAEVSLLVPGTSSIRVSPRRVRNGQAVSFRGRLPTPQARKLVELQVKLSGRYQTFRTIRTGATGTWRVGYRFRRTCGLTRFTFRARLPREAGHPFETGRSRAVGVVVRGRPC